MKKLIISLLLFFSVNCQAIDTDKFAHFGISYALTTVTYGFLTKTLKMNKGISAVLLASCIVSTATSMKELVDPVNDTNDILANSLGIVSAGITISIFDF